MKNISKFIVVFSCIFSATQILPMHTRLSHLRKPVHHAAQLGARNISHEEIMLAARFLALGGNGILIYNSNNLGSKSFYALSCVALAIDAPMMHTGMLTNFGVLRDIHCDFQTQTTKKINELEKEIADLKNIQAIKEIKNPLDTDNHSFEK